VDQYSHLPKQSCEKRLLSFEPQWTATFHWILVKPDVPGVLCRNCCRADELRLMADSADERRVGDAFITSGVNNWKHALGCTAATSSILVGLCRMRYCTCTVCWNQTGETVFDCCWRHYRYRLQWARKHCDQTCWWEFATQWNLHGILQHGTDARSMADMICDVLLRLNLPLSMLCGQTYDGASSMSEWT